MMSASRAAVLASAGFRCAIRRIATRDGNRRAPLPVRAVRPGPGHEGLDPVRAMDDHDRRPGHRTGTGIVGGRDHLRDVADHTAQANERIAGFRVMLRDILTVNATLVAQSQNEEMKQLAESSNAQSEEVKKISAPRSSTGGH
jgi:hypothetical protein